MITIEDLRALSLFKDLRAECLGVLSRGIVREFKAGDVLWQAGDTPAGVCVVLDGRVRVVRSGGGRQHVIHTESRGGLLGDVAYFGATPYPATAIAESKGKYLVLIPRILHEAFGADPQLPERLLSRMAGRVRQLIERLDGVTTQSVTGRLAKYLLDRSAASGGAFTLGGTQQQVAEELGTVREVIVRTLKDLRTSGLIEIDGKTRYRIPDEDRLRKFAMGDSR